MTPLLKLQLRQSEVRKQLSELLQTPEETRSESYHSDMEKATKTLANLETEIMGSPSR